MRTKEAFHKLIDNIADEQLLKAYFQLIQKLSHNEVGKLWDLLTIDEKDELMLSFEESKQPQNLLKHAEVKSNYEKWLKK